MRKSANSALLGSTKVTTAPKRDQDPKRDRHGFRGTPPPLVGVSLQELADDCLLTDKETGAIGRWSTNTLASWRRQPDHPLKWTTIPGGWVRYFAGSLKAYLAAGERRHPKTKPVAQPKGCASADQQPCTLNKERPRPGRSAARKC
jgi:hypothetical protein